VVDGFVDRPLDIAGPIVVLTPGNLPALRVRHISPRLATWMSLVIQGAELERSWSRTARAAEPRTSGV
jgi:hypothetical protein